jgi:hypothetical protein
VIAVKTATLPQALRDPADREILRSRLAERWRIA